MPYGWHQKNQVEQSVRNLLCHVESHSKLIFKHYTNCSRILWFLPHRLNLSVSRLFYTEKNAFETDCFVLIVTQQQSRRPAWKMSYSPKHRKFVSAHNNRAFPLNEDQETQKKWKMQRNKKRTELIPVCHKSSLFWRIWNKLTADTASSKKREIKRYANKASSSNCPLPTQHILPTVQRKLLLSSMQCAPYFIYVLTSKNSG